ncbi:MAG: L-threonylcarbamoyladenylate synthase [Candidatus Nanopelagicales bacterium]|jgi:tRNA threonylcarbamoyl adenosine modification protein (Sua5/YciO/YrdC/YwlC family)
MKKYDLAESQERKYGLIAAAAAAKRGDLVVLPTDTVYGLGTDAFNPQGVEKLLNAKGRERNMPTPVLIGSPNTLPALALRVTQTMKDLVQCFWPGALTLVVKQQPTLNWDLGDTNGTVAVRMPMHPVAIELLNLVGPMAVSSANKTGQSSAINIEMAVEQLGEVVSIYLDGGPSPITVPSTILDLTNEETRVIRIGAIELDEIREVVPGVIGPDGEKNE